MLSFCFPDVSRQLSGLFGSVAQSRVCPIHRAERVERAEHILTLFDQRERQIRFVLPDGLECRFQYNTGSERLRRGCVEIVLVQYAGGERNAQPMQPAIDRNAASAAADDKYPRRRAQSLGFNASEERLISSMLHAVKLADIVAGEYLLRYTDAVGTPVADADDFVGEFLRKIELVQTHDDGDAPFARELAQQMQKFQLVANIQK